jgi:hypothetical protein
MSTDFTKERLELHKSLVEAKEHIEILLKREDNLLEQIELYKQQATELHAALVNIYDQQFCSIVRTVKYLSFSVRRTNHTVTIPYHVTYQK